MKNIALIIFVFILLLQGCKKDGSTQLSDNNTGNPNTFGWTVPIDKLIISQLPADHIQSIDTPVFQLIRNTNLADNQIVYVYKYNNVVKIYPQKILGGHEIVNDKIDNHYFCATYCPLTGSAIAWNREIDGVVTEFGVSGHLYNENLVPYNRSGNSFWSQMEMTAIKGDKSGDFLYNELLVKMSVSTARIFFPEAIVLVDLSDTSCNDSICIGPVAGKDLIPGDNLDDDGIQLSGDYFGIVNNKLINGGKGALLINYEYFNDSISLYTVKFKNSSILIVGSKKLHTIAAFIADDNVNYYPVQSNFPNVIKDDNGNLYDITGTITVGDVGYRLKAPISYTAHSFAWKLFFEGNIILKKF